MSEFSATTSPPITVTIAPSDPVLAAVIQEYGATLNFLIAQISAAVQSVESKVNQGDLTSALDLIQSLQDQIVDWTAQLQTKANSTHTQPISSITGLDQQLAQIAQQLLNATGGEDFTDEIATLQAGVLTKAENSALAVLDAELTAMEVNLQALSAALAGKANSAHSHPISAITGLTEALAAAGQSAPTIGNLTYTVSQSSVENDHTGSYANLTDEDTNTGAGTAGGSFEWLQFDLGAAKFVDNYAVRVGILPVWGQTSDYFNPSRSEASYDGSEWFLIRSIHTEVSTPNAPKTFNVSRRLRYLRFSKQSYIGLTGLLIRGY